MLSGSRWNEFLPDAPEALRCLQQQLLDYITPRYRVDPRSITRLRIVGWILLYMYFPYAQGAERRSLWRESRVNGQCHVTLPFTYDSGSNAETHV
jgi:hypothetical protein